MTDLILSTVIRDLKAALEDKDHPFRYFTLATSDINGTPRLRTVVLRHMDEDLNMTVYTDRRSKKVTHLRDSRGVGLLFFDRERNLQISIRGRAEEVRDELTRKRIWTEIPQQSRKDYTTEQAPGKEIEHPEKVEYLQEQHFFTALRIRLDRIEYLRLNTPNHVRVLFKKENNVWKGTYLVP